MTAKEKLQQALARMDSYTAPADDSNVEIVDWRENCYYEMLHSDETTQLTLADLRELARD